MDCCGSVSSIKQECEGRNVVVVAIRRQNSVKIKEPTETGEVSVL